ncbi:MAG TPA: GIY-YIG nuclease family protein [Chitinophagaceae bacterium]|nr:GIY-YIG nuclease family protein [Chitinophagaceae bacterium]
MKTLGTHNYYVYITTNKNKTVLYTGVTNNLAIRMAQHFENAKPYRHQSFAGNYNAHYLLYFERFDNIDAAIMREKQIKGWTRLKKETLINTLNPEWKFLNDELG